MLTLLRTTSTHPDFRALVQQLDAYLAIVNGDEHAFYDQFNGLETLHHAVVAYLDGTPVGCGAFKDYQDDAVEIKRMFVDPAARRRGVALAVLAELEQWAAAEGYVGCLLETGTYMPDAIALYRKAGYDVVPNYPPYDGKDISCCMARTIG